MDILGVLVGIAGLLFAVFAYWRARRTKKLSVIVQDYPLIGADKLAMPQIEVRYRTQVIQSLSATKVLFYNSGSDVVNRSDVSAADPLAIHGRDGGKLLLAKVLYQSAPANLVTTTTSPDSPCRCGVEFDYLAQREGMVIQLLYAGPGPLTVSGTIKGGAVSLSRGIPGSSRLAKSGFVVVFTSMALYLAGTFVRFKDWSPIPWDHSLWDWMILTQIPVFLYPINEVLEFRRRRLMTEFAAFVKPFEASDVAEQSVSADDAARRR